MIRLAGDPLCENCGSIAETGGYQLPLCAKCRQSLSQRPFPEWIKWALFGTALLFLAGAMRFPDSVIAGVAFERGQEAEQVTAYSSAVKEYQQVVARFPGSTRALVRLAVASYYAGQYTEAAVILRQLAGREVPKESAAELDEIVSLMSAQGKK